MSAAKADVLAVMGRISTAPLSDTERSQMVAARAAVSALIEADREYDAAVADHKDLIRRINEHGWFEIEHDALRKAGKRTVAAQLGRDRALSNIGGGA